MYSDFLKSASFNIFHYKHFSVLKDFIMIRLSVVGKLFYTAISEGGFAPYSQLEILLQLIIIRWGNNSNSAHVSSVKKCNAKCSLISWQLVEIYDTSILCQHWRVFVLVAVDRGRLTWIPGSRHSSHVHKDQCSWSL